MVRDDLKTANDNFVRNGRSFTTTKVIFNRIILEDGKLAIHSRMSPSPATSLKSQRQFESRPTIKTD